MKAFLRHWSAWRQFKRLPRSARRIVFYSEGAGYWPHLGPLVRHLTETLRVPVCYVSSEDNDPGVTMAGPMTHAFVVGSGTARTAFFSSLEASVLVMTMPDLGSFHIKRSVFPVHYVYVHHSMVSTHMVYRKTAFDQFDTIFCVGPHHINETRQAEAIYGLPEKGLFPHGYGRLDSLIERAKADGAVGALLINSPIRILVAPSWGPQGVIETLGASVVEPLLAAGMQVTLRPHPQTARLAASSLNSIRDRFAANADFVLEENVASQDSLHSAHIMISDWSGAALEFAFALERPVVFIDVARKVRNPEYEMIPSLPVEVALREQLGLVISPEDVRHIDRAVNRLVDETPRRQAGMRHLRDSVVFNVGSSAALGAAHLLALANQPPRQPS